MGTTNQTYDVTSTVLQAYLPQVPMTSTGDVFTSARITTIVAHASARLNGVLIDVGLAPDAIASDTDSIAYLRCQELVAKIANISIVRGITGLGAEMETVLENMVQEVERALKDIRDHPGTLGWDDESPAPRARTVVGSLGLDTSDTYRRDRRLWDSDDDHDVHF